MLLTPDSLRYGPLCASVGHGGVLEETDARPRLSIQPLEVGTCVSGLLRLPDQLGRAPSRRECIEMWSAMAVVTCAPAAATAM